MGSPLYFFVFRTPAQARRASATPSVDIQDRPYVHTATLSSRELTCSVSAWESQFAVRWIPR
jgi:hypothetical protein